MPVDRSGGGSNAHREDAPDHEAHYRFLLEELASPLPFGVSELALSGFLRVVTHRKVFVRPTPLEDALAFAAAIRSQPNCVIQAPGPRHWDLFHATVQTNRRPWQLHPGRLSRCP